MFSTSHAKILLLMLNLMIALSLIFRLNPSDKKLLKVGRKETSFTLRLQHQIFSVRPHLHRNQTVTKIEDVSMMPDGITCGTWYEKEQLIHICDMKNPVPIPPVTLYKFLQKDPFYYQISFSCQSNLLSDFFVINTKKTMMSMCLPLLT